MHPGTSPPRLAPSLRVSGAFVEDPEEAGGVTTAEDGVAAPTRRPRQRRVDTRGWRPQTQRPLSLARSQRQSAAPSHIAAGVHRCRPPLSLSTDQVPANAVGYPITHGVPSRARIPSNGQRQRPRRAAEEACVTANTRLAHWEAAKQALHHPFGTRNARWQARQGEQPTGGQSRCGQRHGQEPACHTRARIPH